MNRPLVLALASLSVLLLAGGWYAASRIDASEPTTHAAEPAPAQASAAWVCPMHPQIRQDLPGSCPICGMHLVPEDGTPSAVEHQHEHQHDHDHTPAPTHEPVEAGAVWICPMHAQIQQHGPGRCPICGMDLVRHVAEPSAPHDAGVLIDTVLQQRLGVRLATVERRDLQREIRSWGTVAIDESSRAEVSAKIDGWLRRLHVSAVGEAVRAGQPLYELYSPDLVQRQREYIELLRREDQLREAVGMVEGQNAQMLASLARERLRNRRLFENADLDRDFIDRLEKYRRPMDVVMVRAGRSGVVTAIGARAGSYITPQVNLLSLAGLSKVWIDITLYPDQLSWVSAGDAVTATPQDGRHHTVSGKLQLPNPLIDPASRTVRARLVLDNTDRQLLPGSAVDVRIATASRQVLAIPRSALIRTGTGDKVMRASGDGRFAPTPVQTGIGDDDYVEIVSGLDEGERIAIKGQFLLDAAASLHAATQRMQDEP